MKKHLISFSDRQDIVFTELSKELGIPLSELIRRDLDTCLEKHVRDGSLVRFTFIAGDKSAEVEMPKAAYKKLYDYVKAHPGGALKVEDK